MIGLPVCRYLRFYGLEISAEVSDTLRIPASGTNLLPINHSQVMKISEIYQVGGYVGRYVSKPGRERTLTIYYCSNIGVLGGWSGSRTVGAAGGGADVQFCGQ